MQLFGWKDTALINARSAQKGESYLCPECGQSIRVKSGLFRQPHFFHYSPFATCRQSKKTRAHLAIQKEIYRSLPQNEAILEHPFPSISRIADVAWPKRRIVFEVQCSSISLEEARARTEDYASIGYLAVWVLHTRRFHRRRPGEAERYLRALPAYYTDMNFLGKGHIFDTFPKGPRFRVDLNYPMQINRAPKKWPPILSKRGTTYFSGDLIHRTLLFPLFLEELCKDRRIPRSPKKAYLHGLHYLLQKMAIEDD